MAGIKDWIMADSWMKSILLECSFNTMFDKGMNNVRSWREWFDWEKWGEETRSIDCYDYILSSLKSLRQKRAPICGGRSHATVLLSSLVRSFSKARLYSLNKKKTTVKKILLQWKMFLPVKKIFVSMKNIFWNLMQI